MKNKDDIENMKSSQSINYNQKDKDKFDEAVSILGPGDRKKLKD
jgi:hypothetical protein